MGTAHNLLMLKSWRCFAWPLTSASATSSALNVALFSLGSSKTTSSYPTTRRRLLRRLQRSSRSKMTWRSFEGSPTNLSRVFPSRKGSPAPSAPLSERLPPWPPMPVRATQATKSLEPRPGSKLKEQGKGISEWT
jgi:hypothetical protein